MTNPDRPAVTLQPMSLDTARGLLIGRRVVDGAPWHRAYPLADTLVGVSMLIQAHEAAGWDGASVPRWWIHQVVADGEVVGDIGFHGPAWEDGRVEIGYGLVEEVHGRGIATAACALVLEVAWRDGASVVQAETAPDNLASRRVLTRNGFTVRLDGILEVRR